MPSVIEEPRGVTGNESEAWRQPPADWRADDLADAVWLSLASIPSTPEAIALVNALTAEVAHWEQAKATRGNRRREAGRKKLAVAVGAVTGGLLRNWRRDPHRASYRAAVKDAFTGGPVALAQFLVAVEGLVSMGYIEKRPGARYGTGFAEPGEADTFSGHAPRYRPTARLLDLATSYAIHRANLRDAFAVVSNPRPRKVTPKAAITLRSLTRGQKRPIPIPPVDRELADSLRADVLEANEFAGRFTIEGCDAPAWYRLFDGSLTLHGRWYAWGENSVTLMRREDRRQVRIGGEPVVEIDVRASHLSIMLGLLGLPRPLEDLYASNQFSRNDVKDWVTKTLGKGSPVTKWERAADPRAIESMMISRFPFMARPATVVPASVAGEEKPARVLTFFLMGLEAEAMARAMRSLRKRGVLALPIHDALIVPASSEEVAKQAIRAAFKEVASAEVALTVKRHDEP